MPYDIKQVNILGLNIAKIKRDGLFGLINNYLLSNVANHIVTANPEILLLATRDEEYFSSLSDSSLILPDGIGLKFAALASLDNLYRFTGVELTSVLLARANENNLKVAVVNWRDGLLNAKEIVKYIKKQYSNVKSLVIDIEKGIREVPREIFLFEPDILLCTLGYGEQEKFIFYIKNKIPNLKIAAGIGGTFDLLTGKVKRAPKPFRLLGLEWVYRIFVQPKGKKLWRLRRIFDATFVFVYKFLVWRFVLPFFYRSNVSCLLYKKNNQSYDVLIVERADQPGHWQLPQGGIDHKNLEMAAKLELCEELNTKNFIINKTYPYLYKYHFKDEGLSKYKTRSGKHYGYRGQKQALAIAEFTGNDMDIKVNTYDHLDWRWVDLSVLIDSVHPLRQKATKIYLNKFKKFNNN